MWIALDLLGRIDQLENGEFNGVIWLRKSFEINDTTCDYILKIGSVDDMDTTYINGQKVGGLLGYGYVGTPREMNIPKFLLQKGINIIVIRVIDTGGLGFVNGPITLICNCGEVVSLEGTWKSHMVADFFGGKEYAYDFQTPISERLSISQINGNSPSVLYNALINTLVFYTIKGAIWYQGESNVGRGEQYARFFPIMIAD